MRMPSATSTASNAVVNRESRSRSRNLNVPVRCDVSFELCQRSDCSAAELECRDDSRFLGMIWAACSYSLMSPPSATCRWVILSVTWRRYAAFS